MKTVATFTPGLVLLIFFILLIYAHGTSATASTSTDPLDVLILGGGMAGVRAGETLFAAGKRDFLVLEQAGRVGGRMSTRTFATAPSLTVELGANWIEGIPQKENPIWQIAEKIGLKGNYTNQEGDRIEPTLIDEHGMRVGPREAAALHARFRRAMYGALNVSCDHHRNALGDTTLRAALTKAGWPRPEQQTPLERTLEFFVCDWDFEDPPEGISLFNYFSVGHADSWKEVCGDGGAARPSPCGVMIEAAKRAKSGHDGRVDHHRGHHRHLSFRPPLPQWKAASFKKAKNGIYTKIFLRFPYRFWDDADYVLWASPDVRGSYAVWQDLSRKNDKFLPSSANVLMVTVVQQDSLRVERQDEAATIEEVRRALAKMYFSGNGGGRGGGLDAVPFPLEVIIPKWQSNPAFRGCWSNIAVGANASDFKSMQENLGPLYFAGEATDLDFNGFTLGGFTSGERAAKAVLDDMAKF
eukprot:g531.t1